MYDIYVWYAIIIGAAILYFSLDWSKKLAWIKKLFFGAKRVARSEDDGHVMVCPNCGGTNVFGDLSREMLSLRGITRFRCKDCEFSAPSFAKVPKSKLSWIRRNIRNKSEETREWLACVASSKGVNVKMYRELIREAKRIKTKRETAIHPK